MYRKNILFATGGMGTAAVVVCSRILFVQVARTPEHPYQTDPRDNRPPVVEAYTPVAVSSSITVKVDGEVVTLPVAYAKLDKEDEVHTLDVAGPPDDPSIPRLRAIAAASTKNPGIVFTVNGR